VRARIHERESRRQGKKTIGKKPQSKSELSKLKALSDRFLSQSHADNARDPDLRRAQSLVAQTIAIARAKYPNDPIKASKEVETRRQEVALRIAKGDRAAVIQVRNRQTQKVRDITQEQVLQRDGRSR
jgi:aspartyl/asparaginyl-tRNA synthetase